MICFQHKVMSHRWSMSINVLVMKKKRVFIRLSFFYSKLIYLKFLKKKFNLFKVSHNINNNTFSKKERYNNNVLLY